MTDQTDTGPPPVTHAEQIRWQRRAAEVLTRLLKLAAERDLPAINWTVTCAGAVLFGECLAYPHCDRRAPVQAWRQALGEPDTFREADLGHSGVQLTAVWDQRGNISRNPLLSDKDGWQLAQVTISARILPDLDDGE